MNVLHLVEPVKCVKVLELDILLESVFEVVKLKVPLPTFQEFEMIEVGFIREGVFISSCQSKVAKRMVARSMNTRKNTKVTK